MAFAVFSAWGPVRLVKIDASKIDRTKVQTRFLDNLFYMCLAFLAVALSLQLCSSRIVIFRGPYASKRHARKEVESHCPRSPSSLPSPAQT